MLNVVVFFCLFVEKYTHRVSISRFNTKPKLVCGMRVCLDSKVTGDKNLATT